MKEMISIIFASLPLLFCGCENNPQNHRNDKPIADTSIAEKENTGNEIDYVSTKVLQTVFVIDRKGAEIKQKADEISKVLGKYEYGERLDVIENTDKWFGIRYQITRKFLRNGSKWERTAWEKVYVLKSATGSIEQISLLPDDLNIVLSLTTGGKTENYEKGRQLNDYLKIELVDKQLFESKRSSSVDFLFPDTVEHRKIHGVIELKCQKKNKKYVDIPVEEEASTQTFYYIGQYEFLNKYIIAGSYWEASDYKFVDKTSGAETETFVAYPYVSADKKHIACISANPYETTADLELYSINSGHILHIMSTSFKNWMPTAENGEIFWSSDGYLYLTVTHALAYWKPNGELNNISQCIRIKVL